MGKSKIEWTTLTWNPIVGCSVCSPGCRRCYAMPLAHRLASNPATPHYKGTTRMTKAGPVWTGKLAQAPDDTLFEPLRRRKPATWFVNSMSDLFHEAVPDAWIDRVFAIMALCPQHTFQVLTKRSRRMREYLCRIFGSTEAPRGYRCPPWSALLNRVEAKWIDENPNYLRDVRPLLEQGIQVSGILPRAWLPNVWLGVSTEDQARAGERIPDLLATPAAVRFISAEPLLGPIDLHEVIPDPLSYTFGHSFNGLDWVIVGGESGAKARPMHPDWARSLRDQCAAAGVPFFFKQWGAWEPNAGLKNRFAHVWPDGAWAHNVGKKSAGRLLDGVTHDGMPR